MEKTYNIHSFLKNLPNNLLITPIGDFKIGSQLGQGGNGLVVSATHGKNLFAIKFLINSNNQKFSRFVDEYLGTTTLPPNSLIVRPIQFGIHIDDENEFPYIIMKKFDGVLEKPTGSITSNDLENVIDDILNGLDFLHSNGITHRDIKPQNIFKDKNKYIIGDLGIASFDPDAFSRLSKTAKGERLANFSFSAPEQINSIAAHPTMDIYAFGQVIQWLTTGDVHKGTNRQKINIKIDKYNQLDKAIDACLSNDPSQRPQTISNLRLLLNIDKLEYDPVNAGYKKWKTLHLFNQVFSKSFPKSLGSLITENKSEINRFMVNLSTAAKDASLWWIASTRGDMHINSITELNKDENIWLIDNREFKIDKVMIYRDTSVYANFAIILTEGSPAFLNQNNYDEDQAGYWNGKYITNEEAENGYLVVGNEVIEMINPMPSYRLRYMNTQAWLLAPHASSALNRRSEDDVYQMLNSITTGHLSFDTSKLVNNAKVFRGNVDKDVQMLM